MMFFSWQRKERMREWVQRSNAGRQGVTGKTYTREHTRSMTNERNKRLPATTADTSTETEEEHRCAENWIKTTVEV